MRRTGMMPYVTAAVIAIVAAAAFTNWALPRIQNDFSGGAELGSTIEIGETDSHLDTNEFVIDSADFLFDPFGKDDELDYTGVGGIP